MELIRNRLADELGGHQGLRGPMDDDRPDVWQNRCECGWDDGDEWPGWRERYRQHVADALLPVVQAYAADELRAAGAALHIQRFDAEDGTVSAPDSYYAGIVRATLHLNARADALKT